MFSPIRDPAQLAASPIGAAGTPATGPASSPRGAVSGAVPGPFAGWRASLRRALDVTVAFTTLESYTADDVLRSLAGSADAAPPTGAADAAPPTGASFLGASRPADGPRRRPASSRPRRAHATTPAEQHCTSPVPGGPRIPRAAPPVRHMPATVAARATAAAARSAAPAPRTATPAPRTAAPAPRTAGGSRTSTVAGPAAPAVHRLG